MQENKVKIEQKLKKERRTLQKQMQELEQQLLMVKKNRADRLETTNDQLAVLHARRQTVKDQIDVKLREHHTCLKDLMADLAELRSVEGGADIDVAPLIESFVAASGNLIQSELVQQRMQQFEGEKRVPTVSAPTVTIEMPTV